MYWLVLTVYNYLCGNIEGVVEGEDGEFHLAGTFLFVGSQLII